MPASGIQSLFEEAPSDAVLFYDACETSDVATTHRSSHAGGRTELISASGFDVSAFSGDYSMSNAVIAEMQGRGHHNSTPLSVSDLYNRVLARIRHASCDGPRSNPIHTVLTGDHLPRIMIASLPEPLRHSNPAVILPPVPFSTTANSEHFALYFTVEGSSPNPEAWSR